MHLSATAIKDWLECPQKLKYRLEGEKQQPNAYLVRGTAVHETIENTTITTLEDAKQFFFVRFAELVNEQNPVFQYRTSFSSMVKESNQMLDYYYNWVNIKEPEIKEVERFFKVTIKGVELSGKIDQIRGNNVYDWKTKTKEPNQTVLAADYQFTLYGMVYKELYGDYPENIYFGYLYGGKLIKLERTRKDYKYLEDVASKIIFAAENDIFPRNYGEYTCNYCAYKYKCFDEKGQIKY